MKSHLFAIPLIFLASCNNSEKQSNKITSTADKKNGIVMCYTYSKDSSNVMMRITKNGNLITGDLVYDYFEKDKNTGTLKGQMQGDTLFAEYSFMSEGMSSVREVAFLKKENELIEGFGNMEEKAGKMVFKNKSALKFEKNITLKKSDCK